MAVAVVAVCGIALLSLVFFLKPQSQKAMSAEKPAKEFAAELIAANGTVFIGKAGRNDWRPVTAGTRLGEGDLIRTDNSGDATIRYSNGVTVSIQSGTIFAVRKTGDGIMEISAPLRELSSPPDASTSESEIPPQADPRADGKSETPVLKDVQANHASLFIKLDRIIQYGRSLELIGSVEAGSRLAVNNETVDVAGDGTFKHFTNPFPVAAREVRLVMKVSDLAGRTRVVTTTHDFGPQAGDD